MSDSGKALLLIAIVVSLVLMVQPDALASMMKRQPVPRRVLSKAEMQLFTTTSVTGEIVMVGAQGVLIDQGSQALRVGTTGLSLLTGAAERMSIDSTGKVVLKPASTTIHTGAVASRPAFGTSVSASEIRSLTAPGADTGFLRLSAGGANTGSTAGSYIDIAGSGSGEMDKNIVFATAGVERIRVDSSGNVGLGTGTANSKFTVFGSTAIGAGGAAENTSFELLSTWLRPGTSNVQVGSSFGIVLGAQSASIDSPGKVYFQVNSTATATNNWGNTPDGLALTLTGSGNVGIGTTNPQQRLHVQGGNFAVTNNSSIYSDVSTTNANLAVNGAVGGGSSLSFWSYNSVINHIAQAGAADINPVTRLSIGSSFATRDATHWNRGCEINFLDVNTNSDYPTEIRGGAITFNTIHVAPQGVAAPTERMRIASWGGVAIGTNSPGALLHVNGNAHIGGTQLGIEINSASNTTYIDFHSQDNSFTDFDARIQSLYGGGNSAGYAQLEYTAGKHCFYGNVGIGVSTPVHAMHVKGQVQCNRLWVYGSGDSITAQAQYHEESLMWIGPMNSSISAGVDVYLQKVGTSNEWPSTSIVFQYRVDSSRFSYFRLDSGGFTVGGVLSATGSKNFDIQHPLHPEDNTKHLVHSCVEGPRVDLMYRGKAKLFNGKAYVNIDTDCTENKENAMTPGTFEALTRHPVVYLQNNDSFDRVIGKIIGATLVITCENSLSSDEIHWMVVAERKDKDILKSTTTDSEGYLRTEYSV